MTSDFRTHWFLQARGLCAMLVLTWAGSVSAGLFDDEEARKAILELRQRVESVRQEAEQKLSVGVAESAKRSAEDNLQLRRSLLELQNQIETMKADLAGLRGQGEQLTRDLADLQRSQKDLLVSFDDRLRRFEPTKVTVDGREFGVEPAERREFETSMAIFRKGDFSAAQVAFIDFLRRFPQSGYNPSALFWLGNAQYATRDYKEAVINFRTLLSQAPDHLRAPEAVLSIANCQVELKDTRSARKTLEDLIKAYPQSEAAIAARERLLRLK